jgi:hypothetical protein
MDCVDRFILPVRYIKTWSKWVRVVTMNINFNFNDFKYAFVCVSIPFLSWRMQIHVMKLQEHRHVLGHHLILLAITAVVIEVKTDVPIRNFEVIDRRHFLLEWLSCWFPGVRRCWQADAMMRSPGGSYDSIKMLVKDWLTRLLHCCYVPDMLSKTLLHMALRRHRGFPFVVVFGVNCCCASDAMAQNQPIQLSKYHALPLIHESSLGKKSILGGERRR